jgi:hypothetical protein
MQTSPRKLRVTVTVEDCDSPVTDLVPKVSEGSPNPGEQSVNYFAEIARLCLSWLPWLGR